MGTPPAMSKVTAPDVPPPGVGLNTVTEALPAFCTSEAWMEAVNWVALTKLVARFAPFHRTTELEMKEEPVTVSVKAASPTLALDGETDATLGAGFGGVGVPPPPPPPPQAAMNSTSPITAVAVSCSTRNRRVVGCRITMSFAVAALYERRVLYDEEPPVIDRRYSDNLRPVLPQVVTRRRAVQDDVGHRRSYWIGGYRHRRAGRAQVVIGFAQIIEFTVRAH